MAKRVSMTMTPPIRPENSRPMRVKSGMRALRRACRRLTELSEASLARAVRTKSLLMTSSMLPRVMRMKMPMGLSASAMAGRTEWCRLRHGSSLKRTKPEEGNQPSCSATKYMSRIPAQKAGMDIAERANIELSASTKPPRRTAERMPSGTPTMIEMNSETRAICSVTGKAYPTARDTGVLSTSERPRSPEPGQVLHVHRPVEAHALAQHRARLRRGFVAQDGQGGIAGQQLHHREDRQGDDDDDRDRREDAVDEKGDHSTPELRGVGGLE